MEFSSSTFQVFIAKYSYDPVSLSPNDNPDAELTFSAGDYLFIYGEADEDGFFDGELMDGRRGLVPSNFIEKVPEEDLKDLDKPCDENEEHAQTNDQGAVDSPEQPVITEIIDGPHVVPPPKDLHQERQLSCSYVVAWFPPEETILQAQNIDIDCYQVYCNEQLFCTVYKGDRTKALLEKLDTAKSHRVNVRAVTVDGKTSSDQLCTITIGKNARLSPSAVEVVEIAKRSAIVQWCLASSYLQHRVSVDEQWDHILSPGVFKCKISGLLPNSSHTVCVSCIQNTTDDHSFVSASISFVTLPRDFPDPPTDVQADIGPQKGTILVTWMPAFKEPSDTNKPRKTNITGYNVYIDGRKVKQLHSPTSDHIVLSWKNYDFEEGVTNTLTIRTTTERWESPDSAPATVLSHSLIQEVLRGQPQSYAENNCFEDKTLNNNINMKPNLTRSESIKIEHGTLKHNKQITKNHPEASKHVTLPQIEITRDSLSDSSFDNNLHHDLLKTPVKLRDKKVQTSPKLMKSGVDEVRRRDVSVGCDEISFGGVDSMNFKKTARASNVDMVRNSEEESLAGSDFEKIDGNRVRLFVGLFDYNPISMSPNQDCSNEELQFCEGQLLKVIGDKDADGFFMGESNGVRGLIPSNMVTEVLVYNPLTAEQLLKDNLALCRNKSTSLKNKSLATRQPNTGQRHGALTSNRPRRMIAIYNYNPNKNMPNTDSEYELCLKPGDRVLIFGEPDADGYVRAEIAQRKGVVPINYLRPATPLSRPMNSSDQRLRGRKEEGGVRRPSGNRMLPNQAPGMRRMPPEPGRHLRSMMAPPQASSAQSASSNIQQFSEQDGLQSQLVQQMMEHQIKS